ncbi:MAG: DUF1573 domain-containing protein [Phycisphaeraceae bacterium]|nr:DUF1573 domain-containing protein [Phycisphaerales bacterium]MCB9860980.1 DUF1573 domain-containing protein [Phycisphaeraceae bacterium]
MNTKQIVSLILASTGFATCSLAQGLQPAGPTRPAVTPTTVTPLPQTTPNDGTPVPTGPAGELHLDDNVLDLGIIPDTDKVTRKIPFTNTGQGALTITRVQAHCGCTTPELDKTVYEPGEAGEITVTYDPNGKHEGPQATSVDIYTDNPSQQRVPIQVVAHILPLVSVDPTFVSFQNIDKGAVISQPVTIRGRMPGFKVTSATANVGDGISVEIIDTTEIENEKGEKITEVFALVTLDGTRSPGRIGGNVTFFTNDERRPTQAVSVTGMVLGDVRSNMTQWRLGNAMQPESVFTRTVRLTHRLGRDFKVVDVKERQSTPNDATVQWTVVQPDPDRPDVLDVKLTLIANARMGTQVGELSILTDVKDEPPITVTYFGNVKDIGQEPATAATTAPATVQPTTTGRDSDH